MSAMPPVSDPPPPSPAEHHGKLHWTTRWRGDRGPDGRRPRYTKRFGPVEGVGPRRARALYQAWLRKWEQARGVRDPRSTDGLSVEAFAEKYLAHAKGYYRKEGKITTHVYTVATALQHLIDRYGPLNVDALTPPLLAGLRDALVLDAAGAARARSTVNKWLDVVRAAYKWGTEKGMVAPGVWAELRAVSRLQKGRTEAREERDIKPVHWSVVEATLPHLSATVAAMVGVQWHSGMRPEEVCAMRGRDLERDGPLMLYRPETHKTDHRENARERVVVLGPRAQSALEPFLRRDLNAYLFAPAESAAQRERGVRPDMRPCFDTNGYRHAIHRACDRAWPPAGAAARREKAPTGRKKKPRPETRMEWFARLTAAQRAEVRGWEKAHRWNPNQLRHAWATRVRREEGVEAASAGLGHSKISTTEIYAERDMETAKRIALKIG